MATRKEKKKQVAEGASKSQSSQGGSSKDANEAAIDNEGSELTGLIDRTLRGISGETESFDEAGAADCTAPRPLALGLAKVYKPCALVVKKTELMGGVANAHGILPWRKEGIADWLMRVLYKLWHFDHGSLACAGAVPLLENHEWPGVGWKCNIAWMGGCGLKQSPGGTKPADSPLQC